jgi:hypothetical protein
LSSSPLRTSISRELLIALLFLILSVAMTWPLARSISSYVSDPGDPWLNSWILHWDQWATLHRPFSLFHAWMFHPSSYALAFSEHLYGVALATFPFYLAGASPITVHNLALLLGFALSGYGACVLGRVATGAILPGVIAGIFYAFLPYRFDQLPHLQHIWSGWLPLLLAALVHYARRPTSRRALLVGAAFLMNGLTNIHWFIFGSFAAVITMLMIAGVRRGGWRRHVPLVLSIAAAGLILLPFLLPYRSASDLYRMKRGKSENITYSATLTDWLRPPPRNRFYGSLGYAQSAEGERKLFPGILGVLFAAAGLITARRTSDDEFDEEKKSAEPRGRVLRTLDVLIVLAGIAAYWGVAADRIEWKIGDTYLLRATGASVPAMLLLVLLIARLWLRYPQAWRGPNRSLAESIRNSRWNFAIWVALLWIAIGVLASLGLNAFFHTFLFQKLEIFRSVRVPARWAMLAYTGMVVLVAFGASALFQHFRRRATVATVVAIAFLFELRAAPVLWYPSPPQPLPVHAWLARQPVRGAILELPIGNDVWVEGPYLIGQAYHRHRIINGFSGFEPPMHRGLVTMFNAPVIGESLFDELERIGASVIVVHDERLGAASTATRAWLQSGLRRGKIIFAGRFEHETRGDWVFVLPKSEPAAAAMRGPDAPDRAGRTPRQNLEIFLSGTGETWNDRPFGKVELLRAGPDVGGGLEVSGWARAPQGLTEIAVLLENGDVRIPAVRVPRPDIDAAHPWYRRADSEAHSGFRLRLDRRPEGVSRETYLQVELTDGTGKRTRLDPFLVIWDDEVSPEDGS